MTTPKTIYDEISLVNAVGSIPSAPSPNTDEIDMVIESVADEDERECATTATDDDDETPAVVDFSFEFDPNANVSEYSAKQEQRVFYEQQQQQQQQRDRLFYEKRDHERTFIATPFMYPDSDAEFPDSPPPPSPYAAADNNLMCFTLGFITQLACHNIFLACLLV